MSALILLQHITIYENSARYVAYGSALVLLLAFLLNRRELLTVGFLYLLTYYLVARVLPAAFFQIPGACYILPVCLCVPLALATKFPDVKSWFRKPVLDRFSLVFIGLAVVFSAVALILWAVWSKQLGFLKESYESIAHFPPWIIFGIIIPLLAMFNAAAEESFFRGIVQDSIQAFSSNQGVVLSLQAAAFASIHYIGGFPNGKLGYLMTFVFGFGMGFLRRRTKSLWAPWAAHVIADMTIFYIVVALT